MSKKGNFEKPPKKRKHLTDNRKAIFGVFAVFFWGVSFFLFFCLFLFVCFFLFFWCFLLEGLRVR